MINKTSRQGGFTLLELMIVVVVMAILASIAVTSYNRYAFRARRADGKELLMRVANAQERYYGTFNTYADDPVDTTLKLGSVNSERGYYAVKITSDDLTKSYVATATPISGSGQDKDACGPLSISSNGTKTPAATDTSANSNGPCW
jgi:type IV pilus assembly protein PilE